MTESRDPDGRARQQQYEELRDRASSCRACELWERATQTVFGEGDAARAHVMLVGEQPGDQEDLAGEPFVGPAGSILDHALADAALDRKRVYLTNAVKHFKWRAQGKRRLHDKPNAVEVRACLPWLQAELALVRPSVLVLLGATAAQAALGRPIRIGEHPGNVVASPLAPYVLVTLHPSAVLRSETPGQRELRYARLVADLRWAAEHARSGPKSAGEAPIPL